MYNPGRPAKSALPVFLGIAAAFFGGMAVWSVVFWNTDGGTSGKPLLVDLGKSGLTLAVGGALGGVLKLLFDAWSERAEHHRATQQFYRNILDDLKSVYDEVERARLLIEAHKSAKTYGEQMRTLPDAVIKLTNIERALTPGFDTLRNQLTPSLTALITFLNTLIDEFQQNYIEVSRLQSLDEAKNKHMREEFAKTPEPARKPDVSTDAWQRITELAEVRMLRMANGTKEDNPELIKYKRAFVDHIDRASATLRALLAGDEKT